MKIEEANKIVPSLFNNPYMSDIQFEFSDRRLIYAHKIILGMRIEKLGQIFSKFCENLIIKLHNWKYDYILDVVKHLYIDEFDPKSKQNKIIESGVIVGGILNHIQNLQKLSNDQASKVSPLQSNFKLDQTKDNEIKNKTSKAILAKIITPNLNNENQPNEFKINQNGGILIPFNSNNDIKQDGTTILKEQVVFNQSKLKSEEIPTTLGNEASQEIPKANCDKIKELNKLNADIKEGSTLKADIVNKVIFTKSTQPGVSNLNKVPKVDQQDKKEITKTKTKKNSNAITKKSKDDDGKTKSVKATAVNKPTNGAIVAQKDTPNTKLEQTSTTEVKSNINTTLVPIILKEKNVFVRKLKFCTLDDIILKTDSKISINPKLINYIEMMGVELNLMLKQFEHLSQTTMINIDFYVKLAQVIHLIGEKDPNYLKYAYEKYRKFYTELRFDKKTAFKIMNNMPL